MVLCVRGVLDHARRGLRYPLVSTRMLGEVSSSVGSKIPSPALLINRGLTLWD